MIPAMTTKAWTACSFAVAALAASSQARSQPEMPGPYAVATWVPMAADAAAAPPIPLTPGGVFYPMTGGPFPPVALIHGAAENGGLHTVMATALASRGLVVLAPTFADGLVVPSNADGDAINALLDWSVTESGNASSPLVGKVDGSRRGVIGHSNGGVIFYSAAQSPLIKSIVGLDANAYLTSATGFAGPSLHLLSAHHDCNTGKTIGYMDAPAPKLMATVVNGDHCDVDNPSDPLCPLVCQGTPWNAMASNTFERYAVAWTACILAHDTSVQPWVYGPQMQADVDAGLITGITEDSAALVFCGADGGAFDSGTDAAADAAADAGVDASADADAGAPNDAGAIGTGGAMGTGGSHASSSSGSVAVGAGGTRGTGGAAAGGGSTRSVGTPSGCGCKTVADAPDAAGAWWPASALLALLGGRRRRSAQNPYRARTHASAAASSSAAPAGHSRSRLRARRPRRLPRRERRLPALRARRARAGGRQPGRRRAREARARSSGFRQPVCRAPEAAPGAARRRHAAVTGRSNTGGAHAARHMQHASCARARTSTSRARTALLPPLEPYAG